MARYSDTIRDERTLLPVQGANVFVRNQNGTPVTITGDDGLPLFAAITDEYGVYAFNVSDGIYDLAVYYSGRMVYRENGVAIGAGIIIVPQVEDLEFTVAAVASEALSDGDFVNITYGGTNLARKASATDPNRYAVGFVMADVSQGASVIVVLLGLNPVQTTISGEVWLSDTVAGGFTTTPPTSENHILQSLGIALPGAGVVFSAKGRVIL